MLATEYNGLVSNHALAVGTFLCVEQYLVNETQGRK